jgi:DNA-binding NarL/FixJ family response regulator
MHKLILADHQSIFRAGIAKVLAVEEDMRIVAQAPTPDHMFLALEKFRAEVLIVASGFHPDFDAILQAARAHQTRVVVVADTGDHAERHLQSGAHGVFFRNVTSAALVECVRKVMQGQTWTQETDLAGELTENEMVGLRVRDRLTPKELRIVALIVQGYRNKEIATQLGTTEQVIKNYLRSIYDKIGVSDRLELALFTIHHRLLNEAAAAENALPSGVVRPRAEAVAMHV